METAKRKSVVGLSLVTAMLLGSSAYAGKIITDADVNNIVVLPNTQFGFGSWNFENVDVRITDLEYTDISKYFNIADGTYDAMALGDSFESDIKNAEGVVMGHLHGKDWPVGEPAGIKIINDDTKVSHGKPVNCIMTSSYQEFQIPDDDTSGSGYLDGDTPNPVLCSSGWQTHKRYKINLLPSTVEGVAPGEYGKPVDLVFNLVDGDSSSQRYQVLQKVNNYTDVRLDGYKVEVLDATGQPNDALTLSLGLGEDSGADIWADNELANYSHGLWGPYQEVAKVVRFDNGFFDFERAYYPATLSEDNQTISYVGDMLGGNYQEIFGNWLPSIWAPVGIFNDDDNDPATDGILEAFYGVAPVEGAGLAWWSRTVKDVPTDAIDPVYTWTTITAAEVAEMLTDPLFSEDHVEDVLNLGLNYIINVGDNAKIGSTFTLRLTPHVSKDLNAPIYVGDTPPVDNIAPIADAGDDEAVKLGNSITISGAESYDPDGEEGEELTYSWKVGEETVEAETFLYTPDALGRHTLTLTVTDVDHATGTDTVIVKVRPIEQEPQGPKK